jgi:3-hydroxyacyl-CoA dehydrogenase/enoyl-CoA hydratase/3-hydroxybutyryl-CoA epimerase
VDESVYQLLDVTPASRLNKSDIAKRCVSQMLNEAVRCLEDGIIASPRDGDIGAIFGIGFPPFLGGPFSYMDKLGASSISADMSTFASSNSNFLPCEALVTMANSGATFHTAAQTSAPDENAMTQGAAIEAKTADTDADDIAQTSAKCDEVNKDKTSK